MVYKRDFIKTIHGKKYRVTREERLCRGFTLPISGYGVYTKAYRTGWRFIGFAFKNFGAWFTVIASDSSMLSKKDGLLAGRTLDRAVEVIARR